MEFEKNILRVLSVKEFAFMPELSELNPIGIKHDAQEIGKRNNLLTTRGKLSTGEWLFRFKRR